MKTIFYDCKSMLTKLALLGAAVICGAGAADAASLDLGVVELGKVYEIPYGEVKGTIIAPATGALKQVGSGSINLYSEVSCSEASLLNRTYLGYEGGGQAVSYEVTEGNTYYVYASYNMQTTSIAFYMDGVQGGGQALDVVYCDPDDKGVFGFANFSSFAVQFNQKVNCSAYATITYGGSTKVEVAVNKSVQDGKSYITIPVYPTFKPLLEAGTVTPGDAFSITLPCVYAEGKDASTAKDFTWDYTLGSIPTKRVSEVVPSEMLSYFAPGDPRAIYKITFDREVMISDQTRMEFGWGDLEGEDGSYYYEVLVPTLSADKKTLSVDFSGKLRTPKTMTPLFPNANYENCTLKLCGVVDKYGNPVASEGQGTIGSYSYGVKYTLLEKANIVSEFTPGNGASMDELKDASKLEVWMQPVSKFTFDGFVFTYGDKSVTVAKSACTVTNGKNDDATWSVSIPEEVKSASSVTVTLANLKSTDGYNHGDAIKATYGGFVIIDCDPAAGSELAGLTYEQIITINTNIDPSAYPEAYLTYEVEDLNAVDEDHRIVKSESWFENNNDGSFVSTVWDNYKFVSGHTYSMNVTAWAKESDSYGQSQASPLGTYSVTWEGTTPPYVYSDTELLSITPAVGTLLTKEDRRFVLEFSGLVNLNASSTFINAGLGNSKPFESIVPTKPSNENGADYSNIWTLTVSESFMASLTSQIDISFAATDVNGRRVKGTDGEEEQTYFYYTYDCEGAYSDSFEVSVVGEAPYASVKQFKVTATDGINRNWNVATDAAVVYSKLQGQPAKVIDFELEQVAEDKKPSYIILTLDNELTEAGAYMLSIPQGYFVIGEQTEARNSTAREFEFKIENGGSGSGFAYTTEPAEGAVEKISEVFITFTEYESAGGGMGHAYLSINNGAPIQLPDANIDDCVEWNKMKQPLDQEYTADGTYIITFPEGYFNLGDSGEASPEFSLRFIIGNTGVEGVFVDADGNHNVYNLNGVRVSKIANGKDVDTLAPGVYVIDGVKVMVK